jgi:outer membrane protein assembly factor BamB
MGALLRLGLSASLAFTTHALTTAIAVSQTRAAATSPQASVAYQINPTHTGAIDFPDGFETPLWEAWSLTLTWPLSYPLIAEGRVFITTGRSEVLSIDGKTGRIIWSRYVPRMYSAPAYDAGRIYVINHDGWLHGLNARTGALIWSKKLPHMWVFSSPPTARHGIVYLSGSGANGMVYAIDGATGGVLWMHRVMSGAYCPPTVTEDAVFATFPGNAYRFDVMTGVKEWHYNLWIEGGWGRASALYMNRLYTRGIEHGHGPHRVAIFNPTTGVVVRRMDTTVYSVPSLWHGMGFFLEGTGLVARRLSTNEVIWRVKRPSQYLKPAPIVVSGKVVVGSMEGELSIYDALSGRLLQRIGLGDPDYSYFSETDPPLKGYAAGEGLLVVPHLDRLIALKGATPRSPLPPRERPSLKAASR